MYRTSCWIFMVTSVLIALQMLHSMLEVWSHLQARRRALLDGEPLRPVTTSEDDVREVEEDTFGHDQSELVESTLYLIGSVAFAVGSVLFLPYFEAFTEGSNCFMVGSLGLLLAVYVNCGSMNLVRANKTAHDHHMVAWDECLASLALFANLLGGIFYVVGTVFYYPQLRDPLELEGECADGTQGKFHIPKVPEGKCPDGKPPREPFKADAEWIPNIGTHLYVLGGGCYVIGQFFHLCLTLVKKHKRAEDNALRRKHQE